MPNNMPYDKWYWADWFASTTMLSAMARGVWHSLLGTMFLDDRTYFLEGTPEELARAGRCTLEEINKTLDEISRQKVADVAQCNGIVTIICRRYKKEANERKRVAEAVKKTRCNGNVTDTRARYIQNHISKENNIKEKTAASGDDNNDEKTVPVPEQLTELRIAEKLASGYPKKFGINAGKREALNVIREMFDKGIGYDQIEVDLLDDVTAYSDAVSEWPEAQKRFVWSMETFFKDGHYDDDRDTWIRSENTTQGQNDTPDVFGRLDRKERENEF